MPRLAAGSASKCATVSLNQPLSPLHSPAFQKALEGHSREPHAQGLMKIDQNLVLECKCILLGRINDYVLKYIYMHTHVFMHIE